MIVGCAVYDQTQNSLITFSRDIIMCTWLINNAYIVYCVFFMTGSFFFFIIELCFNTRIFLSLMINIKNSYLYRSIDRLIIYE